MDKVVRPRRTMADRSSVQEGVQQAPAQIKRQTQGSPLAAGLMAGSGARRTVMGVQR
ncbi:hypothetical protein [Streptomyces sp. NPDC090036]|uniref:hypothetical protein n=1 Tax=Streptomyces sp. NPDC090036 TaxID=3365926 RepID=UPI003828F7E6